MAWGCQAGLEPVILTTMRNQTEPNPTEPHATIKLGIDAHAKWFHVARQRQGAIPLPVQKMNLWRRSFCRKADGVFTNTFHSADIVKIWD